MPITVYIERTALIEMTEKSLLYFYEVAKHLNFSEAARQLSITQPALSRQIFKLETELGFELFSRTTKEVHLTPGGILFMQKYDEISDYFKSLIRDAKLANAGMTGQLNIGVQEGQNFDGGFISWINKFKAKYENISLNIECIYYNELMKKIYSGSLDMAISIFFDKNDHTGLNYKRIDSIPCSIIISPNHPLIKEDETASAALSESCLIAMDESVVPYGVEFSLLQCKKYGITPKEVIRAHTYSTIDLWLSLNMGFSIMTWNNWDDRANIKSIPLPPDSQIARAAYWSKDNLNPSVRLFLDFLSDNI